MIQSLPLLRYIQYIQEKKERKYGPNLLHDEHDGTWSPTRGVRTGWGKSRCRIDYRRLLMLARMK